MCLDPCLQSQRCELGERAYETVDMDPSVRAWIHVYSRSAMRRRFYGAASLENASTVAAPRADNAPTHPLRAGLTRLRGRD